MKKQRPSDRSRYCRGCKNDIYNSGDEECWYLGSAKVVSKNVVLDLNDKKPTKVRTLDCFRPLR